MPRVLMCSMYTYVYFGYLQTFQIIQINVPNYSKFSSPNRTLQTLYYLFLDLNLLNVHFI